MSLDHILLWLYLTSISPRNLVFMCNEHLYTSQKKKKLGSISFYAEAPGKAIRQASHHLYAPKRAAIAKRGIILRCQ